MYLHCTAARSWYCFRTPNRDFLCSYHDLLISQWKCSCVSGLVSFFGIQALHVWAHHITVLYSIMNSTPGPAKVDLSATCGTRTIPICVMVHRWPCAELFNTPVGKPLWSWWTYFSQRVSATRLPFVPGTSLLLGNLLVQNFSIPQSATLELVSFSQRYHLVHLCCSAICLCRTFQCPSRQASLELVNSSQRY